MTKKDQRPSEDDLIARYFAPLAGPGGLALKDDAALVQPTPGHDLVVTVDALVAGVHFFADDPPASIALKALGVNLSDLAAKGAKPAGFLLSLALPPGWSPVWLEEFARGLGAAAIQGQCSLLGGDTVKTPGPLTLSITAFGEVPAGKLVRRTTARAGDIILASGTIGDAALGLKVHGPDKPDWVKALNEAQKAFLAGRYLHPRPRQALASILQQYASAAMDVSDGLVGDARKMMRASGVSAVVDLDKVPLSPAARAAVMADPSCLMLAMTGGDDYEILCTAHPDAVAALCAKAQKASILLHPIGTVLEAGTSPTRFLLAGEEIAVGQGSFSHF
jgi:thiamine-monophosphate kinase